MTEEKHSLNHIESTLIICDRLGHADDLWTRILVSRYLSGTSERGIDRNKAIERLIGLIPSTNIDWA